MPREVSNNSKVLLDINMLSLRSSLANLKMTLVAKIISVLEPLGRDKSNNNSAIKNNKKDKIKYRTIARSKILAVLPKFNVFQG